MKLLILELEGTLVEFKEPEGAWVKLDLIGFTPPSDPKYRGLVMRERCYEKIRYYKDRGYTPIVMTDRPDVAMGDKTPDDIFELFLVVNGLLGNIIEGYLMCPDDPNGVVKKYKKESKSKYGLLSILLKQLGIERDGVEDAVVVSHREQDYPFAVANFFKFRTPEEFF